MARKRELFSGEFKREAVKLVGQPDASKAATGRCLGIGTNLLGRWCRDANVGAEFASGREKCRPRGTSASVVSWQKSKRSATSKKGAGRFNRSAQRFGNFIDRRQISTSFPGTRVQLVRNDVELTLRVLRQVHAVGGAVRSNRLVFSFVPRCHGLHGSQKSIGCKVAKCL